MKKIFKYTMVNEVGEVCGSMEEYGEEFEYEPSEEELKKAIVNVVFNCYFSREIRSGFSKAQIVEIKKILKEFIENNDNWEGLCDDFEEELKDYFEDKAFESIE